MRLKLQVRLNSAQEQLTAGAAAAAGGAKAGDDAPASPGGTPAVGSRFNHPGVAWRTTGDKDDKDAGDGDKAPLYITTLLCVVALFHFYDVPEVRKTLVFLFLNKVNDSCAQASPEARVLLHSHSCVVTLAPPQLAPNEQATHTPECMHAMIERGLTVWGVGCPAGGCLRLTASWR